MDIIEKRNVVTKNKIKNKKQSWTHWFIFPAIFALCAVVLVPFIMGIFYAFTKWDGLRPAKFIGLNNFQYLLSDSDFKNSLWFTTKFSFFSVIIINISGLLLALIVTSNFKGNSVLRTIFFMPNLIGGLILGFIWQFIYIKGFSAIGSMLDITILDGWLSTPITGFIGLVIMVNWQYAGYIMVIYIAFLQGVDEALLEAAALDGASEWKKFLKIKLPLIRPAITISIFMTLSFCFKIYDQNLALTSGGPYKSTQMIAMDIVNTAFSQKKMGLAQAKGLVFFMLLTFISISQVYIIRKKEVKQ